MAIEPRMQQRVLLLLTDIKRTTTTYSLQSAMPYHGAVIIIHIVAIITVIIILIILDRGGGTSPPWENLISDYFMQFKTFFVNFFMVMFFFSPPKIFCFHFAFLDFLATWNTFEKLLKKNHKNTGFLLHVLAFLEILAHLVCFAK